MALARNEPVGVAPAAAGSARSRGPVLLVLAAVALELLMVMPFVDGLADGSPTLHFTQHGLIFLGGVLMGVAMRDAYLKSR